MRRYVTDKRLYAADRFFDCRHTRASLSSCRGGRVTEALKAGSIVIVHEAMQEGIPLGVREEGSVCGTAPGLAAGRFGQLPVEVLRQALSGCGSDSSPSCVSTSGEWSSRLTPGSAASVATGAWLRWIYALTCSVIVALACKFTSMTQGAP